MAQEQIDQFSMVRNTIGAIQDWSFDTIDIPGTEAFDNKTKEGAPTGETDDDDSEDYSVSDSSNYVTSSSSPSAMQTQEIDIEQRFAAIDIQDDSNVVATGGQGDSDTIMTDVDTDAEVQSHGGWDPTPEELMVIIFANEDAEVDTAQILHAEEGQDLTPRNDEADAQGFEEHVDDAEDPQTQSDIQDRGADIQEESRDANDGENSHDDHETQTHEEDAQEYGDNAANIENDTNPRLDNPWGMSDAQLEQLRIDQDRLFGYIRDRDSAPKPFSCVCGEASMDPSGFVNLTCPDNCVRCVDCLNANVRVGLESKKNYPPRCCVPIDFENVFYHLEPNLIDRWLDVRPEFEDIAPVYCSVKECSLYLPRDAFVDDGRWAVCKTCDIKTCTACLCPKSQHDENSEGCPERLNEMDNKLIKDRGWKSCPQCREMIERSEGCDHMICECGHEFCYGCGRSYEPPMPCNCLGQNGWVEQLQQQLDPQRQQNILQQIADGDIEGVDEDDEDEEGEGEAAGDDGRGEERENGGEGEAGQHAEHRNTNGPWAWW